MCVVSMITDHFQEKWKLPIIPLDPYSPYAPPSTVPMVPITRDEYEEYQRLKRKAEEYDKMTGQPDCIKPDLKAWEEQIEQVLRKRGIIE